MSALAADIAPSPTTPVEIGTARSVNKKIVYALLEVGRDPQHLGDFGLTIKCPTKHGTKHTHAAYL
jgi:hypothetical protein